MPRGIAGKWRNRAKKRLWQAFDHDPETITKATPKRKAIPSIIPETRCEYCPPAADEDDDQENFDDDGHPIPRSIIQAGRRMRIRGTVFTNTEVDVRSCFRFLDLPVEIRSCIYELVMIQPDREVVCILDHLLRPSKDFPDTSSIFRQCSRKLICLPCQFHDLLGTGHLGLSRANKQLHDETSLVPYTITTFSVHNVYYLNVFLKIIGKPGREVLRSLRFGWKLPEEEAHALGIYTDVKETFTILVECSSLKKLKVDLDVVNLPTWRWNGDPRSTMLNYLHEIPYMELVYQLRGVKDMEISWMHVQGLEGMEMWARTLAGYWRLPIGGIHGDAVPVPKDESSMYGFWPRRFVWRAE